MLERPKTDAAGPAGRRALRPLAKYFWWLKPEEALADKRRLALRTMDIGTWEDILLMLEHFAKDDLRRYLLSAQPGEIRPKALPYWFYKLGIPEEQHFRLPVRRAIPKDEDATTF